MDVINNEPAGRYEIHVGDDVAFAEYKVRGDVIVFTHTEVPHHLEGHGLAGQLAAKALGDARARGLKVVPRCPFFASYIEKHPEYADLIWVAPVPAP